MLCCGLGCCCAPPPATAGWTRNVCRDLQEKHLLWARRAEETRRSDAKWRLWCRMSFPHWVLRAREVGTRGLSHVSSRSRERRVEREDTVGRRSWQWKDSGWSWVRQYQTAFLSLLLLICFLQWRGDRSYLAGSFGCMCHCLQLRCVLMLSCSHNDLPKTSEWWKVCHPYIICRMVRERLLSVPNRSSFSLICVFENPEDIAIIQILLLLASPIRQHIEDGNIPVTMSNTLTLQHTHTHRNTHT